MAIESITITFSEKSESALAEEGQRFRDLSYLVKGIADAKEENRQEALDYRFSWSHRSAGKETETALVKDGKAPEETKGTLGSEAILIGGDFFTSVSLFFEGIKSSIHSLQHLEKTAKSISGLGIIIAKVSGVFGLGAGIINFGVGIVCLKKALEFREQGQTTLFWIYLIEGICLTVIGAVMFLGALGAYSSFFGGIAAFLAAHPYILPIAFFIASCPTIYQLICKQAGPWLIGKYYISEINKYQDDLRDLLTQIDGDNPLYFGQWLDGFDENEVLSTLSQRFEKLQEAIGVEAAIKTYHFIASALELLEERDVVSKKDAIQNIHVKTEDEIEDLLDTNSYLQELQAKVENKKQQIQEKYSNEIDALYQKMQATAKDKNYYWAKIAQQTEKRDKLISKQDALFEKQCRKKETAIQAWDTKNLDDVFSEWKRSLTTRSLQQILFTISFGVTMKLLFGTDSETIRSVQNYALSLANLIPLCMEIFWPFRRNTLLGVKKVSEDQIQEILHSKAQQASPISEEFLG